MYCRECGKELPDNVSYCQICQCRQTAAATEVPEKRTNLLAWSALILGVLAWGFAPLGILSAVIGFTSLCRSARDERWRGERLAWIGLFSGVMSISFYVTLIYQFAVFLLNM